MRVQKMLDYMIDTYTEIEREALVLFIRLERIDAGDFIEADKKVLEKASKELARLANRQIACPSASIDVFDPLFETVDGQNLLVVIAQEAIRSDDRKALVKFFGHLARELWELPVKKGREQKKSAVGLASFFNDVHGRAEEIAAIGLLVDPVYVLIRRLVLLARRKLSQKNKEDA